MTITLVTASPAGRGLAGRAAGPGAAGQVGGDRPPAAGHHPRMARLSQQGGRRQDAQDPRGITGTGGKLEQVFIR